VITILAEVPPTQISAGLTGWVVIVGSGTTVTAIADEVRLAQAGEVTVTIHLKYVVDVRTPDVYEAVLAPVPSVTLL
jgi:hypothetical protein